MIFRPVRLFSSQFLFPQFFFAQLLPHRHHCGFQLRRQPFIRSLARLIQRRRLNRLAEYHLQIRELGKLLVAWPGFIEALDRDRNDRSLRVNRENRGALAEYGRIAVVGALALRIENKNASIAETKKSSAHGGNQVRFRIENHRANPSRQPPHESFAENVAGAERKGVAKQVPGQGPRKRQWVGVALVIRREQERAFVGEIFEAANFEVKAVEREKINQSPQ